MARLLPTFLRNKETNLDFGFSENSRPSHEELSSVQNRSLPKVAEHAKSSRSKIAGSLSLYSVTLGTVFLSNIHLPVSIALGAASMIAGIALTYSAKKSAQKSKSYKTHAQVLNSISDYLKSEDALLQTATETQDFKTLALCPIHTTARTQFGSLTYREKLTTLARIQATALIGLAYKDGTAMKRINETLLPSHIDALQSDDISTPEIQETCLDAWSFIDDVACTHQLGKHLFTHRTHEICRTLYRQCQQGETVSIKDIPFLSIQPIEGRDPRHSEIRHAFNVGQKQLALRNTPTQASQQKQRSVKEQQHLKMSL